MKRFPLFFILILFLFPLCGGALYVVVSEFKDHDTTARHYREILSLSASYLVHEKLDRAVEVGVSLAGNPLLRQEIEKGSWGSALKSIENAKEKFPYIDDIALYNPKGIREATASGDLSVLGKDFSYRDYYQGVSNKWEPYVSGVFKKASAPLHSVVSVAVPIKSDSGKILGLLGIAIKIDILSEWFKDFDMGPSGFIYIVDQDGHLVIHPQVSPDSEIVDYSLAPAVQKVLKRERGVDVLSEPMESGKQLVAYAPVPLYGWGVVVLQPERVAFLRRDTEAVEFAIVFLFGISIIGFFLYRILNDRTKMRAQRDRETILLESIGDGVVAIDRDWNITLWNKAASIITGWSKEETLGKPFRTKMKLIREQDRVENIGFIEDAMLSGGVTSMKDDALLIRKDGSEVPVGDSAAPIFGKGEMPEGVIIVFRDILKEDEKSHLRSDFAYASHQLRTPVTEALWNLETAIGEQDPNKRKEDLRIVQQSLFSVKKLSEHLVSISEIDQGDVALNLSTVNLVDILNEVRSDLEGEEKLHDVAVSVSISPPLIAINTDKKFLGRVLLEIIENAIVYSPQKSKVEVSVIARGNDILIEVADDGVGIPEEEQAIIFTKFFRGSNRGSQNAGSGLGLHLSKAYVALLRGKIWFKSEEGKGTTFFISLPTA